jgi:hypothetical protein
MGPPLAKNVVDYTAGHAESPTFNAQTRVVRLNNDAICSILFGTAPVAATTNTRMAAGGRRNITV